MRERRYVAGKYRRIVSPQLGQAGLQFGRQRKGRVQMGRPGIDDPRRAGGMPEVAYDAGRDKGVQAREELRRHRRGIELWMPFQIGAIVAQ
jgi:hypothetical protein